MSEFRKSGEALAEWAKREGVDIRSLSEMLDVEYQSAGRFINSKVRPSWKLLRRIILITNGEVQPNHFALPTEDEADEVANIASKVLSQRVKGVAAL